MNKFDKILKQIWRLK